MRIAAGGSDDTKGGKGQKNKKRKTSNAPLCSFVPFVEPSLSAFNRFPISINGGPVMRRTPNCIMRIASLALLVALLSPVASAQFKASIQGTVTDSTGAVISGAKVTLVNKGTERKLTTTAGESGYYRITGLAPGEYQIIVERDGFKKIELKEIVISAETEQGVNITLEPGPVSETVTISGESAPRMQTENASI